MTSVFDQLETRGTDAAGFWGCQKAKGKIAYHKEPEKASELIKKDIWHKICQLDPNLLLIHARASSTGVGSAFSNKNNHPFVSSDRSVALVHNGRIPDGEYRALKKKYEVFSSCDSEILLRIFEAGEILDNQADDAEHLASNKHIEHRLRGIRNIWSQITKGQMACAIGERLENGHRRLWLFRNKLRPLWLIDLRKTLGQVFFCSTPEIWHRAVMACPEAKAIVRKKTKLIEFPEDEIWVLTTTPQLPVLDNTMLQKFSIKTEGFITYEHKGGEIKMSDKPPVAEIVTNLDNDDDVIGRWKSGTTHYYGGGSSHTYPNTNTAYHKGVDKLLPCDAKTEKDAVDWDEEEIRADEDMPPETPDTDDDALAFGLSEDDGSNLINESQTKKIEKAMTELRGVLDEVEGVVAATMTMTETDAEDLLGSLEQASLDLLGTLKLLGR
jgi:hypothetical protein